MTFTADILLLLQHYCYTLRFSGCMACPDTAVSLTQDQWYDYNKCGQKWPKGGRV